MTFDFSHLYITETVEVKDREGNVLFTAVVGEITHGQKTQAQAKMFANVEMSTSGSKRQQKAALERSMNNALKSGDALKTSLVEEVSAIKSWTLTDAKGNEVPVCEEAWSDLPVFLSQQIEEVIERLNPDDDEEFPD